MEQKVPNALRPLPSDNRDLKFGDIVTLPALNTLPAEHIVGFPMLKDQKDSDFCAAFASCVVSELQEKVELCPEWVFAVAKMIEGDVEAFGADLRQLANAHCKYGCIEVKDAPYSLAKGQSVEFLRHIENWPAALYSLALKHKKGSYFAISGPYDAFDNLRATLYKFASEDMGAFFGVLWGWSLSQVQMEDVPATGSGHAIANLGWTTINGEILLYIQNSYPSAGQGGRHYFSRATINAFVATYGAFLFHEMPPSQAQHMILNNIKIGDNWLTQLWKVIKSCFIWPTPKNAASAAAIKH